MPVEEIGAKILVCLVLFRVQECAMEDIGKVVSPTPQGTGDCQTTVLVFILGIFLPFIEPCSVSGYKTHRLGRNSIFYFTNKKNSSLHKILILLFLPLYRILS